MWLGSAFLDYEPQYWWWEAVETLRKLVLISVLTVVSEDATSYLWAAFLVSLFALVGQGAFQPFIEPLLDRVQALSLLVTCLTIFYGLMLTHPEVKTADPKERSVQGILLAGCQILVVVLPVGMCWMEGESKVKQHLRDAATTAVRVAESTTNLMSGRQMSMGGS